MNTSNYFPVKGHTFLNQAKDLVPGFGSAFAQFEQHILLQQHSHSLLSNYSRNLAFLALHFGKVPLSISVAATK